MAVIDQTYPKTGITNYKVVEWAGLDNGDTGKPEKFGKFDDKTIHIFHPSGTAFGSTSVALEGSLDQRADPDHVDHANARWFTIEDSGGVDIALTSTDGRLAGANPLWVRPNLTGGTGTGITVSIGGVKDV